MEKSDYLKLVEDNDLFNGMDERTRAVILAAEGDSDMQYYLDMLKVAKSELVQLKKETIEEMVKESEDIKTDLKNEAGKNLAATEAREKSKAEQENENLLNSL